MLYTPKWTKRPNRSWVNQRWEEGTMVPFLSMIGGWVRVGIGDTRGRASSVDGGSNHAFAEQRVAVHPGLSGANHEVRILGEVVIGEALDEPRGIDVDTGGGHQLVLHIED